MIDIIIPSWFPMALCIIVFFGGCIFMFYQDYLETGGIALLFLITFVVLGFSMWLVLSLFGWIPTNGLVPPGPQLFNLTLGAT